MPIGSRISERLQELGISQAELARRVGMAQSSVNALINKNKVGSKHLHRIARELATTPDYLIGEADDPDAGFVPSPPVETVAEQMGLLPIRQIDLAFGMGATFLDDVPVTEEIQHFPEQFVRAYTQAPADKLLFAQGVGDSMQPTLFPNDLMIIDCAQQRLTMADQIWAISYCGLGMIKRLRPTRDGGVRILSDNPNVPEEIAYDGELQLLGRVVAVVRKM